MKEKLNYIIRPYQQGEQEYAADAHQRIYTQEYDWCENFYKYTEQVVYDFCNAPKNLREEMWIADIDGKPAGCIMLVETDNPKIGQLRLFVVEKWEMNL